MLPLLFLDISGIHLPLGNYLAVFQLVDWDAWLPSSFSTLYRLSPPVFCTRPFGVAMCFQSAHDIYVSVCLCNVVVYVLTARSHSGSLVMKHDTLIE